MVGRIGALATHFGEHGGLVWKGNAVHNVPVHDVELGVRHCIQVLQDDFYGIVMRAVSIMVERNW